MHHLFVFGSFLHFKKQELIIKIYFYTNQTQNTKIGRFCALYRIKPHAPPLVIFSVNFFEFQSCDRTNQADYLMR
jgi:hypothetical protein